MGELELAAHRSGSRGISHGFLDWPEHQGERRTELMADVGEKRGFCSIDLRQGFGAFALFLIRAGVGNSRRDLGGHELEEATVLFIQTQPRADSRHEQSCELMRRVRPDGNHDRTMWSVRPGTRGHTRKPSGQILDHDGGLRPYGLDYRPWAVPRFTVDQTQRAQRGPLVFGEPGRRDQPCVLAIAIEEIDERKGNVLGALGEDFRRRKAGLFSRFGHRGSGTELS